MNKRIEQLAEQAYKEFVADCSYTNINPIFPELRDRFARLLLEDIVANMQVEGEDFYYNTFNDYGCVTVKFFVPGDPWKTLRGNEVMGRYGEQGEVRGTGRYRLKSEFAQNLLRDKESQ